jgi:hypothetical protein
VRGDGAGVIAGGSITWKGGEIAGVDAADRWVPPIIGGRGAKLTPSAFWPGGPWAASRAGLNGIPRPVLHFYFVFLFLLFLFCFSYFFHIICKNASNQFKPLSEIF